MSIFDILYLCLNLRRENRDLVKGPKIGRQGSLNVVFRLILVMKRM